MTLIVAVTPPALAVMVVSPTAMPLIKPFSVTVAIAGLSDFQSTFTSMSNGVRVAIAVDSSLRSNKSSVTFNSIFSTFTPQAVRPNINKLNSTSPNKFLKIKLLSFTIQSTSSFNFNFIITNAIIVVNEV